MWLSSDCLSFCIPLCSFMPCTWDQCERGGCSCGAYRSSLETAHLTVVWRSRSAAVPGPGLWPANRLQDPPAGSSGKILKMRQNGSVKYSSAISEIMRWQDAVIFLRPFVLLTKAKERSHFWEQIVVVFLWQVETKNVDTPGQQKSGRDLCSF